ncbi:tail fiber assembly protein [Xenorhabdus bovienii]|nr:tail fiber assembly protein [Xenorhabdus bovienii]
MNKLELYSITLTRINIAAVPNINWPKKPE